MNTTSSNAENQPPIEPQAPKNQVSTKSQYRRRDFDSTICLLYLDQSYQAFLQDSRLADQQNTSSSEIYPKNEERDGGEGEKVSDPNGIKPEENQPLPEDEKEIDPNKEIPEEDNYLVDDEGSIIKEPTREVDDPYRPGHSDEDSTPSKQEEFPDPKKNTETDF